MKMGDSPPDILNEPTLPLRSDGQAVRSEQQQQVYYPPPKPSSIQYQAQSLPDPSATYKKGLRDVIFRIVIAAVVFQVILQTVTPTVIGTALFLDGTWAELLSLASTDFNEYMQQSMEALQNNAYVGLASIAGVVFGVPALLIVCGKRLFTTNLTQTNEHINPFAFCKILALVLGFGSVLTFLTLLIALVLGSLGLPLPSLLMPDLTPYLTITGILYVVVVGPIVEEIIFRGAILRSLQPYGTNFAIVLSSLLFGLYHLILLQGIYAFFAGLVLGYCAVRFSIKWAMLIHMVNNGISMLLLYLAITPAVSVGLSCFFIILAIIAGITGFQELRRQKEEGKLTSVTFTTGVSADAALPTHTVASSKPYKIAFSNPWFIVLLVLGLLFCVGTLLL